MELTDTTHVHVPVNKCTEKGNSSPVSCRQRLLSGEKLRLAKEEFSSMLEAGVLIRSNSP